MDVQKKLDEIVAAVGNARSMPMSASCVVNRAELLAQLDEVRAALPGSLAQAQELIGGREQLVEQARQEAERIIDSAHAERGSLVSGTEIAQHSQAEADRILSDARREAEEIKAEADDYVDSKLANFEVVLTKTLGSVGRGREKLLGTAPQPGADGYEDPDYAEAPERSHDPETLRRRADDYVGAQLGAFEAVLAKTLEAVGRGRQKLHGRIATDELGGLGEAAAGHTTDADYLAELAAIGEGLQPSAAQPPAAPEPPLIPAQQPVPEPSAEPHYAPAAAAQPPGAYPDQGYGQDAYGYPQQDAYGYQQPYPGQDGYGYAQDPYAGYQQTPQAPAEPQAAPGYGGAQADPHALDETSLFDTGMITAEQLRRYQQDR
ncbi:cell division initiation protein [Streptomyces sp. NPDC058045]|uniref:cell division initiation protein n=1 Tax=Streptomyces sp. NPDC058045 TaxID=3346311 RepID=UPI0036EE6CEB